MYMPAKYPGVLIRLVEARFHYIAFQKVPYPYAIAKGGCGKNVQHKLLQTIEKKFFKNLVEEVGLEAVAFALTVTLVKVDAPEKTKIAPPLPVLV
jgi:hypothetical protein